MLPFAEPSVRLARALSGTYRLERELGQGGMATVYLAHDVKHDRRVALKILRPELAAVIGGERFLQEIRVTANLQHPHILQLYDSGAVDGVLYYVMPYVEGHSLRDRLQQERQLPLSETISIARAVASALTYAHRHGVVHRDIKPENILLVDDQPLVADFGIALAVSAAGSSRLTETGMSLGTPHYMSPEQAMGDRAVSARSDVYALGCVVYEMLVGEPPFVGGTAQAVIAKVITERAPLASAQRDTIPPHVDVAIQRALAKVPADRFATPQEFAEALATPAGVTTASADWTRPSIAPSRRARLAALSGWGVAAVAMVALGAAMMRERAPAVPSGGVVRFALNVPDTSWLGDMHPVLSADGRTIAIQVRRGRDLEVLVRSLADTGFRMIRTSARRPEMLLSPDGGWLVYETEGTLSKMRVSGGAPVDLGVRRRFNSGDWGSDGTILYTPTYSEGLWEVSDAGGEPRRLTTPDSAGGELGHWHPQRLPRGRGILFSAYVAPMSRATVEVLLPDGRRKSLVRNAWHGRYVPSGHLLFVRGSSLMAVAFDLDRLEVRGEPLPVLEDLAVNIGEARAAYSISENGTLAYVKRSTWAPGSRLMWVDRRGVETAALDRIGHYIDPQVSPSGRFILMTVADGEGYQLSLHDLIRGTSSRVTRGNIPSLKGIWTPDGQRIIYTRESLHYDLRVRTADGASDEVLLSSPHDKLPHAITPDGRFLVYTNSNPASDIWLLPLDGGPARQLTDTPDEEWSPSISADGRWIAYGTNESGRSEVYVARFPEMDRRQQVSTSGGYAPLWHPGGRELYFLQSDGIQGASFDASRGEVGLPVLHARAVPDGEWWTPNYSISRDGERLLVVRTPREMLPRQVEVVLNWFEELERLVPSR